MFAEHATWGNGFSPTQRKIANNIISYKKERNNWTAYCMIRQKKIIIKATVKNFSDRNLSYFFLSTTETGGNDMLNGKCFFSFFFFSTEHHEPKKVPFCKANGDKNKRESLRHFEKVLREFWLRCLGDPLHQWPMAIFYFVKPCKLQLRFFWCILLVLSFAIR